MFTVPDSVPVDNDNDKNKDDNDDNSDDVKLMSTYQLLISQRIILSL